MPPRTRAPARRRGRPAKSRYALTSPMRRRMLYNPQPVFTETYAVTNPLLPNAAFQLSPSIDSVPQITQYSNLYQKYRILKAQWIIMPQWTGGTDQNAALYNASQTIAHVGTSRVVYAINDTPAQINPGSEADVLKDNGCKIRFLDKKLVITHRPVPDTKDQNGVQMTFKSKFVNFSTAGVNVTHYGVVGWITQYIALGTVATPYQVYCKLTFQLADPR